MAKQWARLQAFFIVAAALLSDVCITKGRLFLSPALTLSFLVSTHWRSVEKVLKVSASSPHVRDFHGFYIVMLAHYWPLELFKDFSLFFLTYLSGNVPLPPMLFHSLSILGKPSPPCILSYLVAL